MSVRGVRDDVLGALALVEGLIASPDVKGSDLDRACVAASALRRANDKLRPPASNVIAFPTAEHPGHSVKVGA